MVYFICIVIYIYIVYIFRLNYKTIINIYMFVFGRIIHSINTHNRMYKHFHINIFNIIIYSKSIYKKSFTTLYIHVKHYK